MQIWPSRSAELRLFSSVWQSIVQRCHWLTRGYTPLVPSASGGGGILTCVRDFGFKASENVPHLHVQWCNNGKLGKDISAVLWRRALQQSPAGPVGSETKTSGAIQIYSVRGGLACPSGMGQRRFVCTEIATLTRDPSQNYGTVQIILVWTLKRKWAVPVIDHVRYCLCVRLNAVMFIRASGGRFNTNIIRL